MFFDLQKASMLKRISALLLDLIMLSVLAAGFGFLTSAVIGYDSEYEKLNARYSEYERTYNISLSITDEEYAEMEPEKREAFNRVAEIMDADTELTNAYAKVMSMTLVIMSVGLLLAFAVSEFIIPLILKNGQTIGKKIFEIGLMQTDHTKLRTVSLAIRTFLGKFTIEVMVPVLICFMIFFGIIGFAGTCVLILLLLLQLAAMIYTKTNSPIHDLLAGTVAVDFKSQMIFNDLQALEEYRQKVENYNNEKRSL